MCIFALAYLLGQKFLVWFFGELKKPKSNFEINWPLAVVASDSLNFKGRPPLQSNYLRDAGMSKFWCCTPSEIELNINRAI